MPVAPADLSALLGVLLDLDTLIEIKSTTGRAKDRLAVPALLELARRRDEFEKS